MSASYDGFKISSYGILTKKHNYVISGKLDLVYEKQIDKNISSLFSSFIETPNLITNFKNLNDSKIANKTVFLKNIGPGRSKC